MNKRGSRALRRSENADSRPQILIFTEGIKTEPIYLLALARAHRARVLIEFGNFNGAPMPLVKHAANHKRREEKDARRGRGKAHDEIWCVFDRDEHPYVEDAMETARVNDIKVAHSNPCIELWFALHFTDQTAHVDRHSAQGLAKAHLDCDKVLSPAACGSLLKNYEAARRRAQRLDVKHAGDGSPLLSNPSSSLWTLVDQIRGD